MASMMRKNWLVLSVMLFSYSCILLSHTVAAKDTLKPGEVLRDNETLVSANGVFQLGFFSPGSSTYRYLGIWLNKHTTETAVWVCNTQPPIPDSSGNLSISLDGNLVIMHNGGTSFIVNSHQLFSTNSSGSSDTSATLLNSGNLVLLTLGTNGETIVWQSFDHPSDTVLPGMKLGLFDLKTAHPRNVKLVSWLSPQVPESGAFTLGINPINITEVVVWQRDVVYWRSGSFDGNLFNSSFNFSYFSNENECYFTFATDYITGSLKLGPTGVIEESSLSERRTFSNPVLDCETMHCRPSSGCQKFPPSTCRYGDTFSTINGSTINFTYVPGSDGKGLSDCKAMCRKNCSCVAFTTFFSNGTGCQVYSGKKEDIPNFHGDERPIIYIRGVAIKDTLKLGEVLRDSDTLVSADQAFKLGFFNPDSSKSRYLGIRSEIGVVWVCYSQTPIRDSSGNLSISLDGNLVIRHNRGSPFIVNSDQPLSTNTFSNSNTSATLLNSGNLVLRTNGETIVWQSFDHPSDMFLPGMKLGLFDLQTAHPRNVTLVSWLSPQVPESGAFTLGINPKNITEVVVWQRDVVYWRNGSLKGNFFNSSLHFSHVSNENECYITFANATIFGYITGSLKLGSTGVIEESLLLKRGLGLAQRTVLDCEAMQDSSGCQKLTCRDGDIFSKITGSTMNFTFVPGSVGKGLSDCKAMCSNNCSCVAFSNITRCKVYYGMKEDVLNFQGDEGDTIYIRTGGLTDQKKSKVWLIIMGVVVAATVLLLGLLYRIGKRKRSQGDRTRIHKLLFSQLGTNRAATNYFSRKEDHDLPLFTFSSIAKATENFSEENKLGEGGFGPVYKGKLLEGQEIAVKRLSIRSNQGIEEFINEVKLISKLQHKNLVRILGCCIQGEEKILIYEFMPNKSLDTFLFDSTKRASLDWRKRVDIIEGIAQGLLYLHKYSRLKIIHRDLKASNILLDSDMNPKISDFGTARIFDDNESQASTNRVIGTHGYMSPEYAMDGLFSVKSDVFSFGVMMLEIVSGKKNRGFYQYDRSLNLLGYVWELWKGGKDFELMDPTLNDSCPRNEVMRYIHMGLLCVQESAIDRPTMSDVVYMLSHETTTWPPPKQPAFSTNKNVVDGKSPICVEEPCSINALTLSKVDAR